MGSPILEYSPVGGVPGTIQPPPPLPGTGITNAGLTQLVNGQNYIDVTFERGQVDNTWIFVECSVLNTTDASPLNIWPGIITVKTSTRFRLYFNGLPDSSNYFLDWAISGIDIPPPPLFAASFYLLTGPTSGSAGVASANFTVNLPLSGTVASPVTITPSDSGGGGTFTPPNVTLTTSSRLATFTYTPGGYGAKTISTTNNGGLTDPGSLTFTVPIPTYSLTGPSGGVSGVPSTNFTVVLSGGAAGTIIVTPSDGGGGGTFTPTTVSITTGAPSATFTYTPASAGAKTIGVTNSGGLTNPANLTYSATTPPLHDGDPVSTWLDSSGNGHNASMTGSARPTFKTNIVNGKPVVRFTSAGLSKLNLASNISGAGSNTILVVMKAVGSTSALYSITSTAATPFGPYHATDGNTYYADSSNYVFTGPLSGAFHVISGATDGAGTLGIRVDGTLVSGGATPLVGTGDFSAIGWLASTFCDGDIAEIVICKPALVAGPQLNAEMTLGSKYGISVPAGSVIDLSTLPGLMGWWKADSLG